jgi:hypothetical protein
MLKTNLGQHSRLLEHNRQQWPPKHPALAPSQIANNSLSNSHKPPSWPPPRLSQELVDEAASSPRPKETQEETQEETPEETLAEETLAEETPEATQEEEEAETHWREEDNLPDNKQCPRSSMENVSWAPHLSTSKATAPGQKNSSTKLLTTSSSITNTFPSNLRSLG